MARLAVLVLLSCWGTLAQAKALQPIKMLVWWDYVPPSVVDDLKQQGFEPVISTYRSNDAAVSRLAHNSEQFDVAVISSVTLTALRDRMVKDAFRDTVRTRQYEELFRDISTTCLPYMWGATVFTYDSRHTKHAPTSIAELLALKSEGFAIGILDDPYEVAARLMLDRGYALTDDFPEMEFKSLPDKKDFSSDIDSTIKQEKSASYSWHGAAASFALKRPWLTFSPLKNHTVIGYDAVCLFNPKNKVSAKAFAEILTNKENIIKIVEMTQYFSPYRNDTDGLSSQAKDLRMSIMTLMTQKKVHVLPPYRPEQHKKLNAWWARIRYGA